ncbi:class I SAM-dependent methyltransferase [Solimonas marina]|uniref:Ribosomal RNA small subunit methyltransferase J n=1 Tax=Solimonas marina TaxID=2714601 RepID=A0A969WD24_9GAMM|nr:class I SAM-dependent methyltransferase [Solimonas marina]NKF22590.1 class I SAM-dependent methyltransferase [Solimonas marina]
MPASSDPDVRSTPAPGTARGFSFALESGADGLTLHAHHHPDFRPIRCDWTAPDIRRRVAGGRRQLLARAIGLHKQADLSVLDATAGLGRDGYVLAALGASVTMLERQPLFAALLADAHARAADQADHAAVAARIEVVAGDAASFMRDTTRRWDVVHLDPMYPHRGKQALPQKEMQILRELTDGDPDADALLAPALAVAQRRVVVKRPSHAPFLAGRPPNFQLDGSQARYDIYLPT